MSSLRPMIAIGVTAFLLAGCSDNRAAENAAEPAATNASEQVDAASADIPTWVTAHAGPSNDCPLTAAEGTSSNPFFSFAGTTDAPDFNCRQTGPFEWGGKNWYVQRIHSLTTRPDNPRCAAAGLTAPCLFDGTRACSKQAVAKDPTPAGSPAGGGGCGVLEPPKFRKKP